jgi:iron complex outermembrane receptor protein
VNPGFVPKAYALVDLFTGLTSSDGAWEVSVAAKNVFNTRTTLNEGINEGQFGQIPFSTYGLSSGYRTINRVPGRSFQISLRYAFGSR